MKAMVSGILAIAVSRWGYCYKVRANDVGARVAVDRRLQDAALDLRAEVVGILDGPALERLADLANRAGRPLERTNSTASRRNCSG